MATHLVDILVDENSKDEIVKELLNTTSSIHKVYSKMFSLTYGVGINARHESNMMNNQIQKIYDSHFEDSPDQTINDELINYIENTFNKKEQKSDERI